jgi:hypothetical protein
MSVVRIEAVIACDGCGSKFMVDVDAAYKPPQGWSMWDVAQDAVRGGLDGGSIQGDIMLCLKCTKIADAYGPEDRNLTADEVRAALRA